MVLRIAEAVAAALLPREYWVHIAVLVVALAVIRAFAQGRTTTRERDLHARVILVTGGFSSFGLTLIQSLAQRGAHIIALSPVSVDSRSVDVLISLIRSTTENEHVYAEQCDLSSAKSVQAFCDQFLIGHDQRIDAMLFAHEYPHIGPIFSSQASTEYDNKRRLASLATFMIITRLLPALLVAPVERDIRIINVVNPFYAAAARSFSPSLSPSQEISSVFVQEGQRSLRMVVLARHLQRVLDALPSAPIPHANEAMSAVPVVSHKSQRSNIVAVSVSPGISRSDTVAPLLNADRSIFSTNSVFGIVLYILLQPILRLLTKSSTSAIQTVLHALFLPTPFKVRQQAVTSADDTPKTLKIDKSLPEELLKPGALYSECAVVQLKVTLPESLAKEDNAKAQDASTTEGNAIVDDGELGGELAGRLVWESFEGELKKWEASEPPERKDDEKTGEKGDKVASNPLSSRTARAVPDQTQQQLPA